MNILKRLGTPCVISQVHIPCLIDGLKKNFNQYIGEEGIGTIAFVPLAQGLLTDKYFKGIPGDSRAAGSSKFLSSKDITEEKLKIIYSLNEIAKERGQSLAQMGLAWVLREGRVTSALIGASKVGQLEENIAALDNLQFTVEELKKIEKILMLI